MSHAAITPITFAAMLMLYRRRAFRSTLTALKGWDKTGTAVMRRRSGAAVAAVHAIGLRLRHRPLEMLSAHAMVLVTTLVSELLGAGATVATTHTVMLWLVHGPFEVLRAAYAMLFAAALLSKLLRSGAAMLLKAGRRAARSAESRISTRTAELLRLLPSAKAMPHPALWAAPPVHLPILRAALR